MIVLLTASISYSKAFKGRNAIINIIEKYAERGDTATDIDIKIKDEVGEAFKNMGYMLNISSNKTCQEKRKNEDYHYKDCVNGEQYNYSIYHYVIDADGNYYDGDGDYDMSNAVAEYYGVLTYMYFEIPLFGRNDRFVFPIYGETVALRGVDSNSFKKGKE